MTSVSTQQRWLSIFFAVAACSWMPHWSCHYYRLETSSSFVVGPFAFSPRDSVVSMILYSGLIGLNLLSVAVPRFRFPAAGLSGLGHCAIGWVHIARLRQPFRFEVFDHPWPLGASQHEVAIVIGFGLFCLWVAWREWRARS